MTAIWNVFLELFQFGLFGLTQFYGGQLGAAIVSLSLLARLALLPLSVRLTLRARAHGRRLRALQPALSRVRERWIDDPRRQAEETLEVYRRADVSPADGGLLGGALIQTPVFVGLFHAVRGALDARIGRQAYLWVTDLGRPDALIAALAAALVGLGSVAGASESQPTWTLALPAVSTAIMAMMLSAGFGLYLAASGGVSILQGLIVRRIEARQG
jgi:YidC/Oxa1 family membrane protein insertase